MKTETEYAILAKIDGEERDVETFNARNCFWKEPSEEWSEKIIARWQMDYYVRKYGKSVRLVRRTITSEIVWEPPL